MGYQKKKEKGFRYTYNRDHNLKFTCEYAKDEILIYVSFRAFKGAIITSVQVCTRKGGETLHSMVSNREYVHMTASKDTNELTNRRQYTGSERIFQIYIYIPSVNIYVYIWTSAIRNIECINRESKMGYAVMNMQHVENKD